MVVGEVAERVDVAVIGGGPGGYVAALRCAQHGKSVVVIERGPVGGVCLNVGCIPSKVLIHAADRAHSAIESTPSGVELSATVDGAAMLAHRNSVVETLTGGVHALLKAAGVEVWTGDASFARPDRLAIAPASGSVDEPTRHLEFANCIVATGSRPSGLDAVPIDGDRVVDSTGALGLAEPPDRLVVIGGGYIGVELGTAWSKLGSAATIIEAEDRILPAMDTRLASAVARRLGELGVDVLTSTKADRLETTGLRVRSPDGSASIPADTIVVAVGRTPNTDGLGLDVAGIELASGGHIPVGPDRRATATVFAVGDVTEGPALAHKATAEAEVAARVICGRPGAFDPAAIPEVVFCDPEIASVGLDPARASELGIAHDVFRFPYRAGSRSRTLGRTEGFVQLLADADQTLIGAQIAGVGAGELISELALAIEMAATVEDVAATIHPHPTMAEGISEAAHGLLGHPLHIGSRP